MPRSVLNRPPPLPAVLLLKVTPVSVTVPPSLYSPPPFPVVEPPVMVRPLKVAATPLSTWNTRVVPPPLIVRPAAGPVIEVAGPCCSENSSWRRQGDRLLGGEDNGVEVMAEQGN